MISGPLVSDELWRLIEPWIPKRKSRPRGRRPPISDRMVLTGILFVLKSGIPWEMLPQAMGCSSGMTCWRRLQDWQTVGAWGQLHQALLNELSWIRLIGRVPRSTAARFER